MDLLFPPHANNEALRFVSFTPTRAAGLARLEAFLPNAGRAYARDRNTDRGPQDRSNVSALSPWIRRRLITEEEVIAAVLRRHSFVAAEKFIQEVFWRAYWKGWLEMRPSVLTHFNTQRLRLKDLLAQNSALRAAFDRATSANTGIDCFDAWTRELIETGWLHNHTRMWFASIWIFTLNLPWQLGADFFYKHLLDADPASNTLSWRWVAGLHTRGKHYLARASNIRDHTLGRFDPRGQLNETALSLEEDAPTPAALALPASTAPLEPRVALLLHQEDLHAESLPIDADIVGIGCLRPAPIGDFVSPAARFNAGAIEDALTRAGRHWTAPVAPLFAKTDDIAAWAIALGVKEVVTPYAPVGLTAWALDEVAGRLLQEGVRLVPVRRAFDSRAWGHAKAGFFKLKEAIPTLIAESGLG